MTVTSPYWQDLRGIPAAAVEDNLQVLAFEVK
jgi:hypothetical protein